MENLDNSAVLKEMSEALKAEAEKRKKHIMKREVPAKRTLTNALLTLTRQELDDIRYNVGLSGVSNMRKADLVAKLVPAIKEFAKTWLVSLVDEQYQAFRHLVENKGISTEFREDEMRLDYFQSVGILCNGSYKEKLAWYMPDEIMREFKKLDQGSFQKEIEFNTEMLQISTGILFYYGVMDFDKLFAKAKKYLEASDEINYGDYMRVILNGSCWQRHIMSTDKLMYYRTVVDPQKTFEAASQLPAGYANISYTKIYEAGVENYIEATDAFKALAQFFMQNYEADVIKAADIAGQIYIILQNGGQMKEVVALLDSLGFLAKEELNGKIVELLKDFHSTMRMWTLKGHTPEEMMSGKFDDDEKTNVVKFRPKTGKEKVGRNDPCPCGSGKKYKKCCMPRDLGQE